MHKSVRLQEVPTIAGRHLRPSALAVAIALSVIAGAVLALAVSACVSLQRYDALERDYQQMKAQLSAELNADQVREILAAAPLDKPADLSGKSLENLDLSKIALRRANLSGAIFFGALYALAVASVGIVLGCWMGDRERALQIIAGISIPLLFLQGERDFQVAMKNFERWKSALGGSSKVSFRSYPDLNHLFMAGTGKSVPAEYATPANVAPAVIADIAEWIDSSRK